MSRKKELLELMDIDTEWMRSDCMVKNSSLSLEDLELDAKNCQKCELYKTRNNVVFGSGHYKAKILIIGEAPGKDEDLSGQPFVGRAGKLLSEILFSMNLNRDDVYITNTVKCRPPENRNPSSSETLSCDFFLENQINLISPNVIILLGKVAAQKMINTSEAMSSLRGKVYYYKDMKIPMLVFYHPAYLLRSPTEKKKVWDDILLLKNITNVC